MQFLQSSDPQATAVAPALESFPLVGSSATLKKVVALAERFAPTRHPVVVTGKTGTGKTLLARHIHEWSNRMNKTTGKFVHLNCAAIPEALLESELFGTERGAFTGAASATKPGFFETAEGGTLFLDEIGEMPLSLQAKLFAALDSGGQFYRLGGRTPLTATARIIVATSIDLVAAVKEKKFREELFYRLTVLTVEMPSLRERREDIIPLVEFFCRREGFEFRAVVGTEEADAVEYLSCHPWPGNVRELENVVKRATVIAEGLVVTLRDLMDALAQNPAPSDAPVHSVDAAAVCFVEEGGRFIHWQEVHREYILAIWNRLPSSERNGNTLARAAGVGHTTACRWIVKLGLGRLDKN